jgi:hypothetical protein
MRGTFAFVTSLGGVVISFTSPFVAGSEHTPSRAGRWLYPGRLPERE